jgi:hypothetical protein
MNKIIIPVAKPRNRFVVLAKLRHGGRHHGPNQRQAAKRDDRRLQDV